MLSTDEKRDTAGRVLDRIWWSVTYPETIDSIDGHDLTCGGRFAPAAAVRYRGTVVAYYSGWGPDYSARICAQEALSARLNPEDQS